MVYKKYGQVLRKLRKQRGLPLIYFEPLGISKAAVAKFECAGTMSHGRRPPVRSLHVADIEIVIAEYRAANRGHQDGSILHTQLVDGPSDQFVRNAVPTT